MLLKPFELRKHKIKEVACISSILSDHHPLGQLCGIAQIGFPERRPEHFVLPACENGQGDPSRGIANWRTALRRITGSIQCPACGEAQNPGKKCRNVECGAKYLIRIHWKDFVSMISGTPRPQGFWNRRRLLQLFISDRKHSGKLWPESLHKKFGQLCTNLCTNPDVGYNRRCLTE